MAKYIDLLREHQSKAMKPAQSTEPTALPDQGQTDNIEAMVTDEAEGMGEFTSVTNGLPEHELLADEEHSPAKHDLPATDVSTAASGTSTGQGFDIHSWLTHCSAEITQLFRAASKQQKADIKPLLDLLNILMAKMSHNPKLIDALELEISNREKLIGELDADLGSLIQKSVMMMLYAIKMGQQLKLSGDELRSQILAAMVHHLGMAQISPDIRNKKEKLSKDEIKEIRKASNKSHDYLNHSGITDAAILLAASQAQERFDGSGPQGLTGANIAYSARIVGLLSMFEALIHYRPYRNRLLPRDAIRELVNHHKKAFDPKLLKALIESISLYPVGTYVQLNSGDVGLVIQIHDRLPLRPVVRMMLDSQGDAINPREIDLKTQPNLMVQRCMYEEALQELKDSSVRGTD